MVAYGLAALGGLALWFPLTGSTPDWFPLVQVAALIVNPWVAFHVALGRMWALIGAVALSGIALIWAAMWLTETLPPATIKVIAVGVPLSVIAYVILVLRDDATNS